MFRRCPLVVLKAKPMRWPPELRIWENGGGIKVLHLMEMLQSFWAHLHEVRMLVVERRVEDDLLGRHGGDVAGRNGSHCCLVLLVGGWSLL